MPGRHGGACAASAAMGVCLALLAFAAPTWAAPAAPEIHEPSGIGTIVNAEDVHMEAYGFSDSTPGAVHQCTTWEVREEDSGNPAWQSGTPAGGAPECVTGVIKNHIHFGDGTFVGEYAGQAGLRPDVDYRLFVRYRNDLGELGAVAERPFRTASPADVGVARDVPWVAQQPGFAVEPVAGGMSLPFDIAMIPDPGPGASAPIGYVAELYGRILTVHRDGSLSVFADGLLDFDSSGEFPGGGEFGLGGIAVQPATGDVFYSAPYFNEVAGHFFSVVVRVDTTGDGSTHGGMETILDMGGEVGPEEQQAASHQVSNVSFGPDGNLYLHQADGFDIPSVSDIGSWRGKILRMNPEDGEPVGGPDGNPHLDLGDGVTAADYVYARGFRNAFGAAWRSANDQLYEVENGPSVDRFARVDYPPHDPAQDFGWDGSNESMETLALYNWPKAAAPVGIAFVEPQALSGSGFPPAKQDHAFVAESGPTFATGRQTIGKRISEFSPGQGGELHGPPQTLIAYDGLGKASVAGIAAGEDGLYFTELYADKSPDPTDPSSRLLLVRYFAPTTSCTLDGRVLRIGFPAGGTARRPSIASLGLEGQRLLVNGRWCGATTAGVDLVQVEGRGGAQRLVMEAGGPIGPGATAEQTVGEVEVKAALGGDPGDQVVLRGSPAHDAIRLAPAGMDLNGDGDPDDLRVQGAKLVVQALGGNDSVIGSAGPDVLKGGRGRDRLAGGFGDDVVDGGKGRDRVFGGRGRDRCPGPRREKRRGCELPGR